MTLDEAIKEYNNMAKYHTDPFSNDKRHYTNKIMAEEYRQIAEWLKELKQLREQTKWTPISEGLPKSDGYYTVIENSGRVCTYVFHKEGNSKEYWKRCAVAWMPSPKPYEAESKGE